MARDLCQLTLPPDQIETDPSRLTWGVVATVKAPLPDIARFAAWHLSLGAKQVDIYLDAPDPVTVEILGSNDRVRVTACDDTYWRNKPERARSSHQMRQAFNASRSYRQLDLDWLAHVDVDEFLLGETDIAEILAAAPPDCAWLRISPAEMLAYEGPEQLFKRTPKAVGLKKDVLYRLYPEFGGLLKQGFIGYTSQKVFTRMGFENLRLGLHQTLQHGKSVSNSVSTLQLSVGHAHAPNYEHFRRHLDYRMTHGSYRNQSNGNQQLHGALSLLMEEEGEAGLRRFYDEHSVARPELVDQLEAGGMLIRADMQLDRLARNYFGPAAVPA